MTEPFHGAKLALFRGDALLVLLRDERADIPNPGRWDLPGGGREGCETPEQTVLRELCEEFGIALPPDRLGWRRQYPSVDHPGHQGWLLAGTVTGAEIARVRFGDEGQGWALMPAAAFVAHPRAVPALCARVAECLAGR